MHPCVLKDGDGLEVGTRTHLHPRDAAVPFLKTVGIRKAAFAGPLAGRHPCHLSEKREPPEANRGAKVFQDGPLHNFGIPDEASTMNLSSRR